MKMCEFFFCGKQPLFYKFDFNVCRFKFFRRKRPLFYILFQCLQSKWVFFVENNHYFKSDFNVCRLIVKSITAYILLKTYLAFFFMDLT